ncbi:hypothetical protein DPMN_096379 [Dreissena polymorpha]|uniref:Uncharacterized protein n=1 Tax=Dreissena polymorpha TaxID=45954 RepID=A0A9D4L7L4_DREPO|nr:hypothetical protein DPMN_095272 [Dreissena polymorpha]KAH3853844.1 hypothetical protein DPMN_096379 [Dreissena polymorpha]
MSLISEVVNDWRQILFVLKWFVNRALDGGVIESFDGVIHSPIGCKTAVNDPSLSCDIEWELNAEGKCASPLGADDHPVCGFTAKGLTAKGLKKYGTWDKAHYFLHRNWTSLNNNGTFMTLKYESAFKILVTQFESHSPDDVYKVKFNSSVSGYDLWNGYVFPDIEVRPFFQVNIELFPLPINFNL